MFIYWINTVCSIVQESRNISWIDYWSLTQEFEIR